MIQITKELIEQVKDYYSLEGLTNTPFWKDECGHPKESYICSFIVEQIHADKIHKTKFDLYVFDQLYYGQEICLRSGPEPQEYCSPGSITDFIVRNKYNGHGWYRDVANLLCHIGKIKWEQSKRV